MAVDPGRTWQLAPCLPAFPPLDGQRRVGPDHGARGGRGRAKTGLRLHRRHGRAGTPEGGWGAAEQTDALSLRLDRSAGDNTQALGRSRGGLGSKIVGVCDAAGRLIDFVLVPGQAHELAPSLLLLRRLPRAPAWALADMACDAQEFASPRERWAQYQWFRHARAASSRSLVRPISIVITTCSNSAGRGSRHG